MNRNYIEKSEKVKKDISFCLITDLHYSKPKDLKKYQKITRTLKNQKRDYLFIGGDLLDSATVKEEDKLLALIKEWSQLITVLIGIGNHDFTNVENKSTFYVKNDFFSKLKGLKNVYVLDNESYETDDFCITGITLPYGYYYGTENPTLYLKEHIKKIDSKKYQILLIHAASALTHYDLHEFDLVLAGHNHNGMVPRILEPMMKNSGLISPGKKWFPKNVRGRFELNGSTIIISGGITKLSKRSKLEVFDCFWNHELTMIEIKKESK